MSYTRRTRLDTLALAVPCGRCRARAGQWCTFRHGWATELHKARRQPVEAAYRAGVDAVRDVVRRSGLVVDL